MEIGGIILKKINNLFLAVIQKIALSSATREANAICALFWGQKTPPAELQKLKQIDD